jgi:hypothetical protein
VQRLVLRQEVHLESAQSAELRKVTRIPVAIARQEVIVNDQPVWVGGDEPAFERNAVHRWKDDVFVLQPDLIGASKHRCAAARRRPPVVHNWMKLSNAACAWSFGIFRP